MNGPRLKASGFAEGWLLRGENCLDRGSRSVRDFSAVERFPIENPLMSIETLVLDEVNIPPIVCREYDR